LSNGSSANIVIVASVGVGTIGNIITNTVSNTQDQNDDNITADDDSEDITVNDIPIANDDFEVINEDDILNDDVLINDTGLSNIEIIVTEISDVNNGTLVLNENGTYTYTPDANFNGTDSFVYKICDTDGDCDEATVFITVTSVNDLPIAEDDTVEVLEDSESNEIMVLEDNGNGEDTFGGDGMSEGTINLLTGTSDGTLELNDNGTSNNPSDDYFVYTPDDNFYGSDSFEYEICDANGDCDQAVVSINVIDDNILNIPKGFSPNGDGVNDHFIIEGIEKYPVNTIVIFNRWGNKVYKTDGYLNDWDGTNMFGISVGGKKLPEGTYFYILDIGTGKIYKGYITLTK